MIDFKLTSLPWYDKVTSDVNFEAACTNNVAGRAWIPVPATIWNSFDCVMIIFSFLAVNQLLIIVYQSAYKISSKMPG